MYNIKLILSYDGSSYLGWQKNEQGPSIEGALQQALEQVLQETITLQAASRTDAGVHARGQVVHFITKKSFLDLPKLQRSLNGLLDPSISIQSLNLAPTNFHPTLDSMGKEYHYHLCPHSVQLPKDRAYSWHYSYPLDKEAMQEAAGLLCGTHDYTTFCNNRSQFDRDPICTVSSIEIFTLEDGTIQFKIRGNRFLYRMVRNLVGTIVYVGRGKLPLEKIPFLLENKRRSEAGITAPAHGLYLVKVFYKNERNKPLFSEEKLLAVSQNFTKD